jgi:hypothetical protein
MTRIRPYLGTICGIVLGFVAIAIWMFTFNFRTGVDYSRRLFPLLCFVLEKNMLYPPINIPFALWYLAAFLHWFIPGVVIDLMRWTFRFCRQSQENKYALGRCLALVGIGWGLLLPGFLFCQQFNDAESKRLHQLEWDIMPLSKPYLAADSDALISVPKFALEKNKAELRNLADIRDRRINEYAVAITVSSVCIILLSMCVFRSCKMKSCGPPHNPPVSSK